MVRTSTLRVSGRVAAVSMRHERPVDMSAVTQEGRSVGLEDHALVLAPVARRARTRVATRVVYAPPGTG